MKHTKKSWAIIIMVFLIVNVFNIGVAEKAISLYIDGEKLSGSYQPILINNSTVAPVRIITEQLGSQVTWDGQNKTVTITNGPDVIVLTIDKKEVKRNSQTINLTVAPTIIDSRTYVPLRFVSEVLGYQVQWNGAEKRIDIISPSAKITEIIQARVGDEQAILVKVEGEYSYTTMSLANPKRFVVDFAGTRFMSEVDNLPVDSDLFTQARASQLSFQPLTSRIVLDCTEANSFPKVEEKTGGYVAIFMSKEQGGGLEPADPDDPTDPPVDPRPPVVARGTLQILADNLTDYTVKGLVEEENQEIYGRISSARVNLRTEPSTADNETIVATVDGGTKLQLVGQTYGWYHVIYKGQKLWVADWLLTLDLEMKRDNVNVRSGPGTSYDVVDTVLRGEKISVTERKADWVKVITDTGKEGYIAEWLVAINERLLEGESQVENVAQEIVVTLANTSLNSVNLSEAPSMVESATKKASGSNVEVKIVLTEPISYQTVKNDKGLNIEFGSALTGMSVSETEGRVTVDLAFDLPVKYTVYQNFLEENLLLDFPYSQSTEEEVKQLTGTIAKSLELKNRGDSAQLVVSLDNLGSYKINSTGYSKNVQLVLLSSSLNGKVIALDPGHGGLDSGASRAGVHEKDVNLSVALKVQKLLADKGVTVVMTRDNDQRVTLSERVEFVNSMNADIAISIHANSSDTGGSGVETIYYSKAENERLARSLQDGIVTATGFRSRGIKPWNWIFVTRNFNMPSALIEMGFLSNAAERQFLASESGQQKIAENIVAAIERFFMYK